MAQTRGILVNAAQLCCIYHTLHLPHAAQWCTGLGRFFTAFVLPGLLYFMLFGAFQFWLPIAACCGRPGVQAMTSIKSSQAVLTDPVALYSQIVYVNTAQTSPFRRLQGCKPARSEAAFRCSWCLAEF